MADVEQKQAANTDGGDGVKAKIFVKSLNGSKQEYKVDLTNDSVRDLKTKLQEREGIPQEQLRIIFRGKLLLDGDKLKDKQIKAGDTLHSAIMLRGGNL